LYPYVFFHTLKIGVLDEAMKKYKNKELIMLNSRLAFTSSLVALAVFLLIPNLALATDCPEANYNLRSQSAVDAFPQDCEVVTGELAIQGDVESLDNLSNITSIKGGLELRSLSKLKNFDGLNNITSVGAYVSIVGNQAITNIDGLSKLTSTNHLNIDANQALSNVDGLIGLSSLTGNLIIRGNSALSNIDGLINLNSIGGRVNIGYEDDSGSRRNDALLNLDGLSNLTSVIGKFEIAQNGALTQIELPKLTSTDTLVFAQNGALTQIELSNLASLAGGLQIIDNEKLTKIEMPTLKTISGGLKIVDNDSLPNLNGLNKLTSVQRLDIGTEDRGNAALVSIDGLINLTSAGNINIWSNPSLETFNLPGVTALPGGLVVSRNDSLTNFEMAKLTLTVLYITWNESLISFSLPSLSDVYSARFVRNPSLKHIDDLVNVTEMEGELYIRHNYGTTLRCQGIARLLTHRSLVGSVSISNNSSPACNSVNAVINSVALPSLPVIDIVNVGDATVSLSFTPSSTNSILFPVIGYEASCSASDVYVRENQSISLEDNSPIERTLTVSGYNSLSGNAYIQVDIDITHSDPSDLVITLTSPQGTSLRLWNNGSAGGENLIGTFPTNLNPVDSLNSLGSEMDGNWTLSIEDTDVGPVIREGSLNSWGIKFIRYNANTETAGGTESPLSVNNLMNESEYSCTVASIIAMGTQPVSDAVSVKPFKPTIPESPSIISVDSGPGNIRVYFTSGSDGGSSIISYIVSCTDGVNIFSSEGTSSPVVVSGLVNGVTYTCTVSAKNGIGISESSAVSESAIPTGSLDIDGNEKYDALTDGLLLLRGMFGLDGDALVTGTVASDATYTESVDIESRIAILGDLADIDGNGDIDALTDGLLTLRYLFGLQGGTLINGVVASDATRTTAEEIEAHLETLMPAL